MSAVAGGAAGNREKARRKSMTTFVAELYEPLISDEAGLQENLLCCT
jgi:hypothetical protein